MFTYKGKNILSDPFYNYQKEQSGFDIKEHKIDYILLTHAHGDHIADVEEVLAHYPEATIIGVPEVCGYFKNAKTHVILTWEDLQKLKILRFPWCQLIIPVLSRMVLMVVYQ